MIGVRKQIVMQWRCRQRLNDHAACRRVLSLWNRHLSGYLPEQFNHYEPINRPCDLTNIEAFVPEWQWPMFFRRRKQKPVFDASFFFCRPNAVVPVHASLSSRA